MYLFKKKKILVTHNGSFHADDIFATATLSIVLDNKKEKYKIIRTRDEEKIKNADYVYDVGGIYDEEKNRFDHHQLGGAGKRENGIEYSSFGLVWKKYGELISGSKEIAKRVESHLVEPVDAEDNGIDIFLPKIDGISPYSVYEAINAFHPSYKKRNKDTTEKSFFEVLDFAKDLLLKEIEKAKDQEEVSLYVKKSILELKEESQILILDEYIPREELWIEMIKYPSILFVVAPGSPKRKQWRILGIRKNMESFELRKNLPEDWGGKRDNELKKVTSVNDAVFCHRKLFMAVTESKEGAIKLAKLAL